MEDVSANEGRTVIFVSHNMSAVRHICNRGILLDAGFVKVNNTIEKVVSEYNLVPQNIVNGWFKINYEK